MSLSYFLKRSLLSAGLLSVAPAAYAQVVTTGAAPEPAPPYLLLKAGLRLTHLSYSPGRQTWRLVVPFSVAAEYRLASQFSIYSQAEADVQASHALTSHRRSQASAVPAAALSLGLRYYYNQPARGERPGRHEAYGTYLALEGNVAQEQVTAKYASQPHHRPPTSLTPGVYAFWGAQHALRHCGLYDVNAGLGFQAPAYYNFERLTPAHYNVAAQVNIRLYVGQRF